MDQILTFKFLMLAFIAIIFIYIAIRLVGYAFARSWFDVKLNHELKQNGFHKTKQPDKQKGGKENGQKKIN